MPARLIANKMQAALGQPVVVENKTGAAGMIALKEMLAQPRDGHTLLLCSYIDAINPLIFKKVDYKLDEIVPVSLVQKAYYAIAVPNALPANNLKEFIAHAKANAPHVIKRDGNTDGAMPAHAEIAAIVKENHAGCAGFVLWLA